MPAPLCRRPGARGSVGGDSSRSHSANDPPGSRKPLHLSPAARRRPAPASIAVRYRGYAKRRVSGACGQLERLRAVSQLSWLGSHRKRALRQTPGQRGSSRAEPNRRQSMPGSHRIQSRGYAWDTCRSRFRCLNGSIKIARTPRLERGDACRPRECLHALVR